MNAQTEEKVPSFIAREAEAAKKSAAKASGRKLRGVEPQNIEPQKPKLLIYGKAEAGKTFGSLGFPKVYYFDTESGATRSHYKEKLIASGGQYFGVEEGSQDFKTIIDEMQTLATIEHPYKTVVIDSITKIYNIEIGKEAVRLGDKDAFGASKKPAINLMRQLISWIDRIDMNVVLISHERALWSDQKQIGVTFDGWEKLEYELDLCFNIVRQGDSRKAYVRKSRLLEFESGSSFDWSYDEFAKKYGKSIMETAPKQIILATAEQLVEFAKLKEMVKIPEGQDDKWLTWAKAESFSEMDTEKMDKIINQLKGKLPK